MVFPESYGRMWQWAESENLKELLLLAYWEKGLCFPPFFSKSCDKVGWFEICICVYAREASGIGLETARVLALRNVHVIIAARNMEAANEAKHLILKDYETACVDVLKLDLFSINSIKAFVNHFNSLNLPLNILMYSLSL
ncbi:hypothetical protein TEA_006680 [Camellia sinensis var. sinensis]|uniref:Uncharacterized protein n=1 Tax=Camellia sinensis var. sinensis TaxID=542762 RepID=A0A4S4DW87_CAMSN|nr:hypothetical protein TEA_006680 [Camellia sinensis var. sinensis]